MSDSKHPTGWMTDEEYAEGLGEHCPLCRSDNISNTEELQQDAGRAFQNCTCYDCGLSFSDGYYLRTYDPHFCDCTEPDMSTSIGEKYPRCLLCGCIEEPTND